MAVGFEPEILSCGTLKNMRPRLTLHDQLYIGLKLLIYAYYSFNRPNCRFLLIFFHFATNVDIVSHNHNSMKSRKITRNNKEFM